MINYLNLNKIDSQVNDQANLLIVQQDNLIQYFTSMTSETLLERIRNVQDFASFAAKFSYFNNLFSSWSVSESGDPMMCKEFQMNLTDSNLGVLRDMSKSHNTPIMSRVAIPSFFTSSDILLNLADQKVILDQFGSNLNVFNYAMRDSFSNFIEERIGILTIQLLHVADFSDYRGIYHIFPGGCSDVEAYRSKISSFR